MLEKLGKGDEVITNGGIAGQVTSIGDNFITVEVAAGVQLRVQKGAITSVLPRLVLFIVFSSNSLVPLRADLGLQRVRVIFKPDVAKQVARQPRKILACPADAPPVPRPGPPAQKRGGKV